MGSAASGFEKKVRVVFGIAGALLVAGFIWTTSANQAVNSERSRRHAGYYAERASARIAETCTDRRPAPHAECVMKIIEATRENQRSEYDLAAQEEMADWTFGMLGLSVAAVLVSLFGLLALLRTVKHSEDTLAITREMMEIENRPIMVPAEMEFRQFNDQFWQYSFRWKNAGKLPALIVGGRTVKFSSDLQSYETDLADTLKSSNPHAREEIGSRSVIPAGEHHISQPMFFTIDDVKDTTGKPMIFGYAVLEYRNALAESSVPWRTEHLGMFSPGLAIELQTNEITLSNAPMRHENATGITGIEFCTIKDGVKMT